MRFCWWWMSSVWLQVKHSGFTHSQFLHQGPPSPNHPTGWDFMFGWVLNFDPVCFQLTERAHCQWFHSLNALNLIIFYLKYWTSFAATPSILLHNKLSCLFNWSNKVLSFHVDPSGADIIRFLGWPHVSLSDMLPLIHPSPRLLLLYYWHECRLQQPEIAVSCPVMRKSI